MLSYSPFDLDKQEQKIKDISLEGLGYDRGRDLL